MEQETRELTERLNYVVRRELDRLPQGHWAEQEMVAFQSALARALIHL